MSVLIGHASISENGTVTGRTGDQTGREVCTRSWYSKPWNVMLICTDAAIAKRAAQEMKYACANNNVGYDQNERTSAYNSAKNNGGTFKNASGETDCSQLVAACYILAGLTSISKDCYTGNLRKALIATGKFKAYTDAAHLNSDAYAQVGAVYLNEGHHVVMALENGSKAGQSSGGTGTSTGTTSGGFKSSVRDFQKWLNNNFGAGLAEDNAFGNLTKRAAVKAWQKTANNNFGAGLAVDGAFGSKSKAYGNKACVKKGSKGTFVYIAQGMLRAKGYYKDTLDGLAGSNTRAAIEQYQDAKGLVVDGSCGANTWYSLFN